MPTRLVDPARSAAVFTLRVQPRWLCLVGSALGAIACSEDPPPSAAATPPSAATPAKPTQPVDAAPSQKSDAISIAELAALKAELLRRHPASEQAQAATAERIAQGLRQVAALWRTEGADRGAAGDGDFAAFVREHYIVDAATRQAMFSRFEAAFEQLDGHLNEISREWRRPSETDSGPLLPVDGLLSSYDPTAHVADDLFQNKLAFVALLNFPLTTLADRLRDGGTYSRQTWAELRLTSRFARRVPASVQQRIATAQNAGERYVASYNIYRHHVLDENGERLFPKGGALIAHWNLRDQIRGDYGEGALGGRRQRAIAKVMERIVEQSLPQAVINNPRLDWNPFTNTVVAAPAAEIEDGAPANAAAIPAVGKPPTGPEREPDTRYALLLDNFQAQKLADPYSPTAPTLIARSFELGREIPEARTVALLTQVCSSPLATRVAALIQRRLGRPLAPHDLWYSGFKPRQRYTEAFLDRAIAERYPTPVAFEADLGRLLLRLGFRPDKARFLAEHIRVDASRGAGHAMQAMRRGDFPRLRTRVEKTGMNYKGYNIAVHELGHNAEQVFSLYGVDHTLLAGVPNNAFTEALAFVFQLRDLDLLNLPDVSSAGSQAAQNKNPREDWALRVLGDFYATWEIAGVALVDIAAWHYMYEHPGATPAELREAVVRISRETWNRFYAGPLGARDALLLGVYSHMIQNTLYLPDYPLGHLIAFQIEEHLRAQPKTTLLGDEFERMARHGQVTPDAWLIHATGAPLAADALLQATAEALAVLGG